MADTAIAASSGIGPLHKRVRFNYDDPEEEHEDTTREKKLRFPKGKKGVKKLDTVPGEEPCGPMLQRDPRVAATERAVRRTIMDEQLRSSEDTSVVNDVVAAEEEYETSDQEDENGVQLEPFNLKKEREEGYFDADGNYVEYKSDREYKDAWLDSVQVDTRFAERHITTEDEIIEDLTSKEIATIKRRIADALQPGETVLHALRRLKGSPKEKGPREKLTGDAKAKFESLTEDAMRLLDNGEYDVYNETKETFDREAGGYEALIRARDGLFTNSGVSVRNDMFGDDADEDVAPDQNIPSRVVRATTVNIFGGDENEAAESNEVAGNGEVNTGYVGYDDSGYVYDESSGYYYNANTGYYYDAQSGLFCNAASGKWYRYEEQSTSYVEMVDQSATLDNNAL